MYTPNNKDTFYSTYNRGQVSTWHLFTLFLLYAIIAILPKAGFAEDYYIDPINGDDSNPGTSSAPWKNLQTVFEGGKIQRRTTPTGSITNPTAPVAPGDTIKLRTGYHGVIYGYTGWYNNEGPITIEADTGHNPQLGYIYLNAFYNWIFRGLEVRAELTGSYNMDLVKIYGNSHHITVEDCKLLTALDSTVASWSQSQWSNNARYGVKIDYADDIIIRNNNISNIARGVSPGRGNRLLIEYNTINKFTEDALNPDWGDDQIWQYNTVRSSLAVNANHDDGLQIWINGAPKSNTVIRGNFFDGYKDPSIPFISGFQGIFITDSVFTNMTIENNLLVIDHWHGISVGDLLDSKIINNTIVLPPGGTHSPWLSLWDVGENVVVKNNIVWGSLQSSIPANNVIVEDNLNNISSMVYDIFTDYDNRDFTLKPGSPAIDAGSPDLAPNIDILGISRPQGPGYDIGAYEYKSVVSDTTAPSVPQNLTATAVSESQIDLSWDPSTDPESGISYYKIYRDGAGTHIDTSVSTSYSDTGLNAGTSHSYQVSAVNGQNLESNKSNIDSATTSADTTPPTIQSVSASETSVTIVFSETMDANSAENKDFYTIKSGTSDIPVLAASLGVDLITVTLTTLSHAEGSYTLTVVAVRDIAGNTIVPASIDYEYSNGLVGYWKFDEATGNTTFDSSGSGHNGTLVNGPTWTTGKIGSALLFDGTNNYVDIGAPDIACPWTASFWVKREDSSNSNAALLDSPGYSLKLEQYPNLNKVGVSTYGVADYVFNYEAPIGKWAHLVFVGTQTQVTLYVDGNLAETIAASISCPMAQISSVSRATKGTVDEVRTYNRALNAAEVSELYDAGNSDPVTHTLDVLAVNGSVTKTPDKTSYNHGEEVTLQSEPDTGYTFVNWSGDLTGISNPATIVMDADKTVTANFTITVNTYTLNITADNGSVTKTPDQASYDNGTTVTLQATANTGYGFAGWSGDASGTSNPTTVVMDGNKSVTANFTINTYTLGITAINGSVAKTPDQASYNHGTTVTLQATANTGYSFAGWSGDASGTGNPTTVVMDGNKSVTANFTINTYTISASAGSNGQISPDGITQVNYGASQEYTITADPGYKISDVIVDGISVGAVSSYSFTNVTANRTIAASFVIDEIDVIAPTVNNLSPQADSIQAPLNTLITLDITDPGDGVDANSVTIKVNNETVYSGNTNKYSSAYGECYRTGTKADYTFIYQENERFNFDQTITVMVNAKDLASNVMDEYSYSFQTKMRSFGKNKKVNTNKNLNTESVEFASIVNNDRPTTCSDSKGNIWATWHAGATSNKDIYVNKLTPGSEAFGNSFKLTDSTADQCNPVIAVGSDDKLYVAWQDNRRGNWDIYISTSSDGINWTSETRITDSNDNQYYPAIVVDSSNKVYIVWEDIRNSNQDIYIGASNNGFVTKTISQITSDLAYQGEPAIAVDSDNTVYVVWKDTRNGNNDIYGAVSNNGPWTNIPVVTTEKSQSSPAIATESVGSILHLVWVDNTPGNNDIYYAKTTSGLPASPLIGSSIIDDTTGADQLQPAIVVSGSTSNNLLVFVCWKDERNTDYDIYFAELGSGSGTNVFVDDDGTNTGQADPAIGIDGDGYPYLVWTDNRNSNTDIYYAGSTSIESTQLASGNISTSSTTILETTEGVSVVVPAGAYPCDIKITISEIKNPPTTSKEYLSPPYDFGPSGLEFDPPVTITIPYEVLASGYSASAYWYNLLTASPSQQGITDIETIMISSTTYLRFKTTHFTQFFVGGSSDNIGVSVGGGGGGGCSMSANSHASIVELLLPYIGLTVTMVVLKLKDRRKSKAVNCKKS